jgi:ribosomal protein S14
MKESEKKCRVCGNNKGFIRKYNLNLCRRCFKDHAEKIGFKKYD